MNSASSRGTERRPVLQGPARRVSRLHRWLGTGFSLLFALWFGTGFVMVYVPFPGLPDGVRIAASTPVDLASVAVTPSAAASGLPAQRLRLVDVLGRPRYLATLDDGGVRAIDAVSGATPAPLTASRARALAARFAGAADDAVTAMAGPIDYDQWIVHQRFDAARPFYRLALNDAAGTEVYVSARLGQVLQRTTRFERGWNWVGAVLHWMYPTVLRKHFRAWDQAVWWVALAGLVVACSGYALGLVRMANARRAGTSGLSPFRGWLRWHHLLGLVGGAFAVGWVFSGWLSMDHGRLFSLDRPDAARLARFRGVDLAAALARARPDTPDARRALADAREIEFIALDGDAFAIARGLADGGRRIVPLADGRPQAPIAVLPESLVARAVAAAWAPVPVRGVAPVPADDAYAHTRSEPLPDGALRVRLGDAAQTWVHVDPRSGQIVSLMDASRRRYRWLYTGLHTFDFPILNRWGTLWRWLMLAALASGFGLSVSALVLARRRLARKRAQGARSGIAP